MDIKKNKTPNCSFCGKPKSDKRKVVAGGDGVNICNECVDECRHMLEESEKKLEDNTPLKLPTPEEINKFLNDYVIGQEYAKKTLSVAVYNHYKRLNHKNLSKKLPEGIQDEQEKQVDHKKLGKKLPQNIQAEQEEQDDVELGKSNILLIGPTGSGKTLLAEALARMLNVPFAIADATTLTEAGYVGDDIETIVQKLLQKCDYDVKKAQTGIIYIDEIDKISRKGDSASITRDVSGEGVQQGLLKLIEGTVASVPPHGGRKHPQQEYLKVDTKNILFICGGAFAELDKIIRARTEKSGIGFAAEIYDETNKKAVGELLRQVEPEDLIKFGLIPEFIGRLPVISVLDELGEDEMVRILKEPKNALTKQYRKLFMLEGVDLEFEEAALKIMAKKSLAKKAGARGLRSIMENLLLNTMYHLPSQKGLSKVIINAGVVNGENDPILIYAEQKL